MKQLKVDELSKAKHFGRAPGGGYGAYRGGQFIPASALATESNLAQNAFATLMAEFESELQYLRQVYEMSVSMQKMPDSLAKPHWVPLEETEHRMRACIERCYTRAAVLGRRAAGNLLSLSDDTQGRLIDLRHDEYQYLSGFADHMAAGAGKMPYDQRMDMYAKAIREAYWVGWVSAHPKDATLVWHTGPTEHCEDCLRFEKHGPYSVAEFIHDLAVQGYYPQSGKLACLGYHCQCFLTSDVAPGRPVWLPGPSAPARPTLIRIRRTQPEIAAIPAEVAQPPANGMTSPEWKYVQPAIDELPEAARQWMTGPYGPMIKTTTLATDWQGVNSTSLSNTGITVSGGTIYVRPRRKIESDDLLLALGVLWILKHEHDVEMDREYEAAVEDGRRLIAKSANHELISDTAKKLGILSDLTYLTLAIQAATNADEGIAVSEERRSKIIAYRLRYQGKLADLFGEAGI